MKIYENTSTLESPFIQLILILIMPLQSHSFTKYANLKFLPFAILAETELYFSLKKISKKRKQSVRFSAKLDRASTSALKLDFLLNLQVNGKSMRKKGFFENHEGMQPSNQALC